MLTQSGALQTSLGRGYDSGVVLNPGAPVRCPQLETGADLPDYKVMNWNTPTQAELEWGTRARVGRSDCVALGIRR